MTDKQQYTESQLHAYVDNQLDQAERAQILDAISKDPELALIVSNIQRDMELLRLAYHHCPTPKRAHSRKSERNWVPAMAASIFLVIGVITGLIISNNTISEAPETLAPSFSSVDKFSFARSDHNKVMIHVSSNNKAKLKRALDKAETILRYSLNHKKPVNLTIVANADGLGLLRQGSSFGDRIKNLSKKYGNLKFKACGIAMETVRLKEGRTPKLLPEAIKVPNALGEILNNLKNGWIYLKN